MDGDAYLRRLTPVLEARLARNPSLNIDTFIIPSPYVQDRDLEKDYDHSYVWDEEGELLGYVLVYASRDRSRFHVYKQVTSPFGRGKGIGSAFLFRFGRELPVDATVYLYVWEKQPETLLFFVNKWFARRGRIVYRNLVSNSLDAIEEAGRPGVIRLSLREQEDAVTLVVEDNGMGMEPERTAIGPDGLPAFVGRSTKAHRVGEGQGTRQIFATFGQDRIRVESEKGRFTRWTMACPGARRAMTRCSARWKSATGASRSFRSFPTSPSSGTGPASPRSSGRPRASRSFAGT